MTQHRELITQVGYAGRTEHRFRGHALFGELVGNETSAGLLALAVSGRRITPAEASVLDDLAVVTALADPRIWPLKITRLVASYGRTLAAFAAGHVSVEGLTMGMWQSGAVATLLLDLARTVDAATNAESFARNARLLLAQQKMLVGYGVYFRPSAPDAVPRDERVDAFRERLARLGRTDLPYWRLFERFNEVVRTDRMQNPTIAAAAAAALLDMGFTPAQISALAFFANSTTFIANAVEAAEQKSESLQSLPVDTIAWRGRAPRHSPRAEALAATSSQVTPSLTKP
jgi:hypothetical protein